ncbi:F0F1 ATP synthase subunit A [Nocardioides zeae]|uniref:ATP synthase subunit a n=1 Tax=Nocardioides imazamoxiresistens TaxID=3231893 RepID=A0ABU3Q0U7_9ACTN|nr:F0F1 ATP synthase subunit A [Nocardioides zeae]MDT9595105.1 F0F1 ATP synthase subunit A [Nocardioides zeae]
MSVNVLAAEDPYIPGPSSFDLPPIFGEGTVVTKPMVQIVVFGLLAVGFLYLAARKRAMVPGRLQFAGETAYGFVRNSLGRDIIGSHDFQKFVPYLVTMFFFLLFNNWAAAIPGIQFPTFSRAGLVYGLAAISWLVYNGVGIRKHGFLGYLKLQTLPSGVTGPVLLLIVPLEFFSNLVVRPVTLALRLFCNLFAGHLLLILFSMGGYWLIFQSEELLYAPVGVVAWLLFAAIYFLELLILFLQAYVFTLLNAMYIAGALADEH